MKIYFIVFVYIMFASCKPQKSSKTVSFNIEGILNNSTIKKEFGDRYHYANGFVTINNNLDSIIYVPTDSANRYIPPCFYSFPNKNGVEESSIESEIPKGGYTTILPGNSKKFITRIPFIPIDFNTNKRMSLTYIYTTKYQGLNSSWILVEQKFNYDSYYEFKPSIIKTD